MPASGQAPLSPEPPRHQPLALGIDEDDRMDDDMPEEGPASADPISPVTAALRAPSASPLRPSQAAPPVYGVRGASPELP